MVESGNIFDPHSGYFRFCSIDWELLINIYKWFWKKLSDYKFYQILDPKAKELDPEYFKNQFYKFKDRWIEIYAYFKRLSFEGVIIYFGKNRIYYADSDAPKGRPALNDWYLHYLFYWPREEKKAWNFLKKLYSKNTNAFPLLIFPDLSYLAI